MRALILAMAVVISGCATVVHTPATSVKAVVGPNHAGPNAWNRDDSAKVQAFCYAEVLEVVKGVTGVTDVVMPEVKAMWFDCMKRNGGVM